MSKFDKMKGFEALVNMEAPAPVVNEAPAPVVNEAPAPVVTAEIKKPLVVSTLVPLRKEANIALIVSKISVGFDAHKKESKNRAKLTARAVFDAFLVESPALDHELAALKLSFDLKSASIQGAATLATAFTTFRKSLGKEDLTRFRNGFYRDIIVAIFEDCLELGKPATHTKNNTSEQTRNAKDAPPPLESTPLVETPLAYSEKLIDAMQSFNALVFEQNDLNLLKGAVGAQLSPANANRLSALLDSLFIAANSVAKVA